MRYEEPPFNVVIVFFLCLCGEWERAHGRCDFLAASTAGVSVQVAEGAQEVIEAFAACPAETTCKVVDSLAYPHCEMNKPVGFDVLTSLRVENLQSNFDIAIGTDCLVTEIIPNKDGTAHLKVALGNDVGGFYVSNQNGNYGINIERHSGSHMLKVTITHGAKSQQAMYQLKEPERCIGQTNLHFRAPDGTTKVFFNEE